MNPPLVQSLNLKIKGVSSQAHIAACIVRSLELEHLKELHGYAGMGSHQQYRAERLEGKRQTWEKFVEREAGVTDATHRNFMKCADVVKERLRILPPRNEGSFESDGARAIVSI